MNILVFAGITVLLCGARFQINGTIIESPTQIIASIPNTFFLVLRNLAPKHLTFKRAGRISAALAVLILPWNLYNSPLVIVYFLSGLGALLGPLYGVIMVDYWLVRKGRIDVPALYSEDPSGAYYYSRGVNLRAVAAFIPAALIAIVLALVPGFHTASPFSWMIGVSIAAMLYLIIARRQPHYAHVSCESIAVVNAGH